MGLSFWMPWIIWGHYAATITAQVENRGICELLETFHFQSIDIFTSSTAPPKCIKPHYFRLGLKCPQSNTIVPTFVPNGEELRSLLYKCPTIGTQGIVLAQVKQFEELVASRVDQQVYFWLQDEIYEFYFLEHDTVLRKLAHWPYFYLETFQSKEFWYRRSNLLGQTLRVLVEPKAPYLVIKEARDLLQQLEQEVNGTTQMYKLDPETLDGIYPRLLQVMSEQLNVSLQFYRHIRHDWGDWNASLEQWTGGLGILYRGQVDMIGTSLTLTSERWEGFQFLPPIGTSHDAIFIQNNLQHQKDWDLFFRPFTPALWHFLSIVTVVFTVLVAFIQYFYERPRQSKGIWGRFLEMAEIYWILFSSYFGKSPPTKQTIWRPKRIALEVFLFSIFLVGNIIFMTFRASLTSELSVGKVKMPFSHPDELLSTKYR